eukprot:5442913-Amphidinium_carterae.1
MPWTAQMLFGSQASRPYYKLACKLTARHETIMIGHLANVTKQQVYAVRAMRQLYGGQYSFLSSTTCHLVVQILSQTSK